MQDAGRGFLLQSEGDARVVVREQILPGCCFADVLRVEGAPGEEVEAG